MENKFPHNWVGVPLEQISEVEWGNTTITKKAYVGKGYPAFSASGSDGFLNSYENDKGSIILSAIGAKCGKCFLATGKWTAIKNTIVITPDNTLVSLRYLFYYLNDAKRWQISGSGQPFITMGSAGKIQIPLPPLFEQNRIVAKLDALLAPVNACKARLDKMPVILKNFRQAVLAAAVSGELTREWREKNGNKHNAYKDLKKSKKEGIEFSTDADKNWVVAEVGGIYASFGGGTPNRSQHSYWGGRISWVSSGDVKTDIITEGSETITKEGLENSSAKLCPVNSVIVVVRSGILQHTFPVAIVKKELSINQDLKCFDSSDEKLNYWLYLIFKARQKEILSFNREGTTVQSVKMDTLTNLAIEIPSFMEQAVIAQKVNELLKIADSIELRYQKAKWWFDKILQAILAKAFRGELVPQDERDEPAGEFLKRIKESQLTSSKVKQKRKKKMYAR